MPGAPDGGGILDAASHHSRHRTATRPLRATTGRSTGEFMALFDLPLEQLRTYRAPGRAPTDFDSFWSATLTEARTHDLQATFTAVDTPYVTVDVFDVTFAGWDGQPVKGWLTLPRARSAPLPCVVEFIGYGGGRGLATDHLSYASLGYAHLLMDTRGQGSVWRQGD